MFKYFMQHFKKTFSNEKGFLPLLAAAAVGAGYYFANKKKKKPQDEGMVDAPTIPQLTDYPIGSTLESRILGALNKGENIGYGPEWVDKTTSPLVASRQAGWQERELPFLNAEYGGRGLSRSTLATRDIGKGFAQKERDINEIIANAYAANEERKKTDIGRYENLGFDFVGRQQGIGQDQSTVSYEAAKRNANIESTNRDYNRAVQEANNKLIYDSIMKSVSSYVGGGGTVGGVLASGSSSGGGGSNVDLNSLLSQLTAARNTSPYTTSTTSYGSNSGLSGATGYTTPYYLSSKWGGRG